MGETERKEGEADQGKMNLANSNMLVFRVGRRQRDGLLQVYLTEDRPSFRWSINYRGVTTEYVTMLALPNDQQCTATIAPVDAKGNPAQVQGAPTWTSSSETVATVTAADDGLSAVIKGVDVGTCQINVQADADLGEGVSEITGVLDVTVVGGTAVGLDITTGALEPQTPAAGGGSEPPVVDNTLPENLPGSPPHVDAGFPTTQPKPKR